MNTLGLESEPLCISQESLLPRSQSKFPRDSGINIAYLADRRGEEVVHAGKLPQQPIPNHMWQVYSEVAIQMRGGRGEWLLDQLFPIIVTVVNCIPRHLHLCIRVVGGGWGGDGTPSICQMINRTTSLQIRGWMSCSVLSEYITVPGQVFSIGCWQIGACIHQWNDKDMFLVHICYLHLSLFSIHSYACSPPLLFAALHRHGPKHLFCCRRFFLLSCSDKRHQTWVTSGWLCHDDTQENSIIFWMFDFSFVLFSFFSMVDVIHLSWIYVCTIEVLVSNYSESNCYQTKSQKCYYPMIHSWQPHQSWMVTMIAAKSHFM